MLSTTRIEAAAERSPLVGEAFETARTAHAGQIRNGSGGRPYIEHPMAVAEQLAAHDFSDTVLAAALLHDVVEESETEVAELRQRFGDQVGDLVAALTDAEETEDYERRKDLHRTAALAAGRDALAIYGADKLANIRALRRVYADQGESVGAELKAPLDVKVAVWESDAEMLRSEYPDLAFLGELEQQLRGLREDRLAAAPPLDT
ncbi:MAG: bifunctional (p)ppGpp synthetase/guanosine-3',5'-bis(diphosphate) 3'-pyrophosphohydrolase [Solirubrobacterales bacterium]|nr:bifunctional (p)ppGpp synthetase/guanosine-3',5'-bis(diphosphate) 3'-pyrophosphohydrolase [Solirubrobacterales bacterium]